jgi:two-component system phosphate regulon response regulator OmpR
VEACDGQQGRALAPECDLVITDLLMPNLDGYALCKALRARSPVPIIAMSAMKTGVEDRVRALRTGADDYIPKPFEPAELLARVEAVVRRARLAVRTEELGIIRVDCLVLDLFRQTARFGDRPQVSLTPTECRLLARLAQSAGRPVSRQELQVALWGNATQETEATVASYIVGLRRKIEPDPKRPRYLTTVREAGYQLF